MRVPENKDAGDSTMASAEEIQAKHHPGKRRRRGWGLLAYYLAGGAEHRHQSDRRYSQESDGEVASSQKKRVSRDRRHVVNTKYLNCGKIMDRRDDVRRSNERFDETAAAQDRYWRLGPGWL